MYKENRDDFLNPQTGKFEVSFCKGINGLRSLESDWYEITGACQDVSYFQRYEWNLAYLRYLETDPDDVFFFLVAKDQKPVAIFPLKREYRRKAGIKLRCWLFPRSTDETVHLDFAASSKDIVLPAFRALKQKMHSIRELRFDAIILRRVLDGSNAWKLLTSNIGQNNIIIHHSFSKYLACDDGNSEGPPGGSGKFRRNLRRLEKRLNEKGKVSWHYLSDVHEQCAAFQDFLEVEAAGWKGEEGTGTAIKFDMSVVAFYRELINTLGTSGRCRINILKLNDKVIAGQYCLLDEDRINLLKIGYDEAYRDTSPGFLLIKNVFENGCNREEFKELSFVTGSDWNDVFQPNKREVIVGYIFDITFGGIVYLVNMRAKVLYLNAKKLLKRWIVNSYYIVRRVNSNEKPS